MTINISATSFFTQLDLKSKQELVELISRDGDMKSLGLYKIDLPTIGSVQFEYVLEEIIQLAKRYSLEELQALNNLKDSYTVTLTKKMAEVETKHSPVFS